MSVTDLELRVGRAQPLLELLLLLSMAASSAGPGGLATKMPIKTAEYLQREFPDLSTASRVGKGSFGQVLRARASSSGRLYAIKTLRDAAAEGALALTEEARRLWACRSEHVVPLLAAFRTGPGARGGNFGAICMPLADTSLNVFLDSREEACGQRRLNTSFCKHALVPRMSIA